MSEAKPTPGPWNVWNFSDSQIDVAIGPEASGVAVAQIVTTNAHGIATDQTMATGQANARHIVACVNACDGLDTELLENITTMGDTLASRFKMRDQVERELEAQRDELLAALIAITTTRCDGMDITPINDAWDIATAAIAKATGHKEGQ